MQFKEIEAAFLDGIKESADTNYGIQVVSVGIKRLGIPESVTREVFSRMKEDRQKEIKQLTAEGEATAKQIRADADEKSKRIIARAEAYAKTIEGQGDASRQVLRGVREESSLSDFLKKWRRWRRSSRRSDHARARRGQSRALRLDPRAAKAANQTANSPEPQTTPSVDERPIAQPPAGSISTNTVDQKTREPAARRTNRTV